MRISDVSKNVNINDKVIEDSYVLTKLLSVTGDTSKSGYLDDSITGMNLDEFGNLQFNSHREKDGRVIDSTGVVFNGCVLIKQEEKVGTREYFQIYSWDVAKKCYTYISFDGKDAMINCFDKIRRAQVNLHNEDISLKFSELGVSFDDIAQVKLHQDMKSFSLDDMLRDIVLSQENEVSLSSKKY